MRRILSRRPSGATAIAFVALFAALAGGAVALPGTNSVTSNDIRKNAVKGSEIARNAVKSSEIRRGAVKSSEVRNNSLTGNDINEATLGKVPSAGTADTAGSAGRAFNATNAVNAANAQNAAAVDGASISKIARAGACPAAGEVIVFNRGGLRIQIDGDDGDLEAETTVDGASIHADGADHETPVAFQDDDLAVGGEVDLTNSTDDGVATGVFVAPGATPLTFTVFITDHDAFADCVVAGTVTG